MNKTFSLSRFGHYFIYDFRRWAVSYGPTLLLMAAMPLIQYTLILVYSLIFSQTWETPGETTRIVVACITTCLRLRVRHRQARRFRVPADPGLSFREVFVNDLEYCLCGSIYLRRSVSDT